MNIIPLFSLLFLSTSYARINEFKPLLNHNDYRIVHSNDIHHPGFFGDIAHLKSLPNLRMVSLWDTCVTGNEELFHKSREDSGLEECEVIF